MTKSYQNPYRTLQLPNSLTSVFFDVAIREVSMSPQVMRFAESKLLKASVVRWRRASLAFRDRKPFVEDLSPRNFEELRKQIGKPYTSISPQGGKYRIW